MKTQITKLNESSLRTVFDPVTAKALANAVRIAGNETDSITVPQVAEQADNTDILVATLQQQVTLLQDLIAILQSEPVAIPQDNTIAEAFGLMPVMQMPQQVEFLQTEVRQIAERLAQVSEHFTTEVRQIADQQIVNSNLIQELRQGTML